MNRYSLPFFAALALCIAACQSPTTQSQQQTASTDPDVIKVIGSIERLDPAFDALVPADAQIEVLTEGHDWTEGPLWIPGGDYVLYSDIPPNSVFKWKAGEGKSLYLKPAGFSGGVDRQGEPGSNGLLLDQEGNLILCQHGDRRIAMMDADLGAPAPEYLSIADKWEGKRFNSPNDAVMHSSGDIYFTDPPYGLEKGADDPLREIPFQGVYRVDNDGNVQLLFQHMTRPNGIAFSPDEKMLYVANSDPALAIWMAFDVNEDGTLGNDRVFFDATASVGPGNKGLPDGLKVDDAGNVWATGPGGVLVFSPQGKHLGTLRTGEATSNCAFGNNGQYLYATADMYLVRVRLKK